jgi:hypothetical protein
MIKYICVIIIVLSSCNTAIVDTKEVEKAFTQEIEKAYFEGQKDAINGDIKIKLNNDSIYQWIKSPWNDNREPIFNPKRIHTHKRN